MKINKYLLRNSCSYFIEKCETYNRPDFFNDIVNVLNTTKEDNDGLIDVDKSLIKKICKYCEDNAIYDKLGRYSDFYYKFMILL